MEILPSQPEPNKPHNSWIFRHCAHGGEDENSVRQGIAARRRNDQALYRILVNKGTLQPPQDSVPGYEDLKNVSRELRDLFSQQFDARLEERLHAILPEIIDEYLRVR